MLGLTLGVMVMILVLSVMNGFDHEMRTRVLGMIPHATVESPTPVKDWQALARQVEQHARVEAVAPFTQMQGLLTHEGKVQKVLINAIDPEQERKVSIIDGFFQQGSLDTLQAGEFAMIIGDKAAGMFPRLKRFTVTGIFHVGAGEIDGALALANISDLARLQRWQPDQVQGLRLKFDDLFQAPRAAWEIAQSLDGDFYARDWTRTHGNLYQAIRMEKTMIGLLLLLIVAVNSASRWWN
jgi:lipoprotein-releasing system permease protein